MFTGQTLGGEPISIPVNGANQMPKPIFKQPSPYELLKPTLTDLEKSLNTWDDSAAETVKGQLDIVLEEGGEPALKSLAVDHYHIPLEEAERLSNTPAEGYTNALEQIIEGKFVDDAQVKFKADQVNAYQRAQLELKKQEIQKRAQQEGKAASASLLNYEIKRAQNEQYYNALTSGDPTEGGLVALNGANGLNIEFDKKWPSGDPYYVITDSKGNDKDYDPESAAAFLQNNLQILSPDQLQKANTGGTGNKTQFNNKDARKKYDY